MKGNVLEAMKERFGEVYIRHDTENNRTIGIIVNGTNVHVGISKKHPDDQLNRRLGRSIALGRAKRAYDVYAGKSALRARDEARQTPLFFTLETEAIFTEQAVDDLISGEFFNT